MTTVSTVNHRRPAAWHRIVSLLLAALCSAVILPAPAADSKAQAALDNVSIAGGLTNGQARLVIEALLKGLPEDKKKLVYVSTLEHVLEVEREKLTHQITATFDILQGEAEEFPLTLAGDGLIKSVTGKDLLFWSLRADTNHTRTLVLLPVQSDPPLKQLSVTVVAETELDALPAAVTPLSLAAPQATLSSGFLKVVWPALLDVQTTQPAGLLPVDLDYLPKGMQMAVKAGEPEPLAFRLHGTGYALPLKIALADPEARQVVLQNVQLTGQLSDSNAAFTLTATVRVRHPEGGTLDLLAGAVALTELEPGANWRLKFDQGRFVWMCDQPGEYPLRLKFNAAVRPGAGWNTVDFRVASSALLPVTFQGLAADTQFQFAGAAKPERTGNTFTSFLPPDGAVKLAWKEARPEAEGKLFYSAEMLSQVSISPGLMRQVALVDGKVMQGDLLRLVLTLRGDGEVTRVQGDQVLAWAVEAVPNSTDRRLTVQFNQPQKDQFSFQVQMQLALGAFPQTVNAIQLRPEDAIRFAGYYRIVNEGAVRLEVVQASGVSQISPEQFPESDATKALLGTQASQRFAFRFSSAEYQLRIQADNILPELTVSEVLTYVLGENEQVIEAEIELDIREAPLRELVVLVPKGYTLTRHSVPGLSDYFLTEPEGQETAQLRLVYGQPTGGRQVLQLRLERSKPHTGATWTLPRVEVTQAKSTRGQVGVAAEAGFRLVPEATTALTEIATAFFPKKVEGIQVAYRLSDANWAATLRIERLPQSIQADAFHLFSIGEGIAYGSSTINYLVSGAPIGSFRLELSDEYFNPEFTGKDVRNWQKIEGGYQVQLHTPVAGAYTLLATYERPFKAQGDTLKFTGARPLDAQSEQGHTIVISAYQFQVQPASALTNLLPLETGEVPPEYRLFFDAPILAAYRYTSRPFNLELGLSPLAQKETLGQVADRAIFTTRISKEGQVLTDARYFVKNRGQPHFRLSLPADTQLWTATVNGRTVVPVRDNQANLIPLPQRADPNAVNQIDLKLASRASRPTRVTVAAPIVLAPVLLAEWKLEPDTGQRLVYRSGTLTPVGGVADVSGFAGLARMFSRSAAGRTAGSVVLLLVLLMAALAACYWASREGVHRFSVRHWLGTVVGLAAFVLAGMALLYLGDQASLQTRDLPRSLTFVAPVQQSQTPMSVEVANLEADASTFALGWQAWPALFALVIWGYSLLTANQWFRPLGWILGWLLLAWATLRWPNGAPAFFGLAGLFLLVQVVIPGLKRLWQVPRKPKPATPPEPPAEASGSAAPAAAALLLGGLLCLPSPALAKATKPDLTKAPPLAESVIQQIRVDDKFALATATIRWQAEKNQQLPLLREPAVLTRIAYPADALKLVQLPEGSRRTHYLLALQAGAYAIELQYQLHVGKKDGENGLALPTHHGLVNQLQLTLLNLDVDVSSAQAVSVQRDFEAAKTNTTARLVLLPVNDPWIGWKPRSRDVRREKAEFYAELFQLYVPTAGVIEGTHQVQIRPARGELSELVFDVPAGATITDVVDPARAAAPADAKSARPPGASIVSLWRFDPDSRKLRVSLNPPQSRPFALVVLSQVATGPLPFTQAVGLLTVTNAAGKPIGLLGVATGSEVQLDDVTAPGLSTINLEDFPGFPLQTLAPRVPGLTLRRAFRYSDSAVTVTLKAAPVEPDVRVTTVETLSLGEDRTVLAANVGVAITRAGIFRLSFALPPGLEVESISSPAMSHWTELKTDAARVITMHLKGKTEGQLQLSLSLSGPGVKAATNWAVPQLIVREASKQLGQLIIVPEVGLRVQARAPEGVSQFDPKEANIRQKGVLAFRLLQVPWTLALDIEQVPPWIQVTSLQHVLMSEAQMKIAANLQYQIENTGLKALQVGLPTNAESVRIQGDQVADFLPAPGSAADGMQPWDIKLHRRIMGKYLLQVNYQVRVSEQAAHALVRGVQTRDANLQRGFLTVQSSDRLEVRPTNAPPALQPTEWQSIPRELRQDLTAAAAHLTYRLVDANYALPLRLERREAAKLLAARVQSFTLTSVISDDGVMLTQARLDMQPGDKRLLHVTLPKAARFWFAFVNQNGVWPWTTATNILIPLEQQSRSAQTISVEFFYSSQVGVAGTRSLDLELLGPKFDLPLENLTWRIYLNEKWELEDWTGTLQLQEDQPTVRAGRVDVETYLRNEAGLRQEKTKEAEQLLQMGNTLLERGDPQQARRAFQAAYGLSTHDDAFNEDARVQLHNLKLQQALVGLNVRQATLAGEPGATSDKLRELRDRKGGAYTQQEARQIIDSKSAEDNAAFMRLAERLIQQQDAAVASASAIRANIPEQGRLLTFRKAVQINPWAEMRIELEAAAVRAAPWGTRFLILVGVFVLLALGTWVGRRMAARPPAFPS